MVCLETVSSIGVTRSLDQVPIHESMPDTTSEIQQLRQQIVALTAQSTQLEAANQAWLLYQQTQLATFTDKLQDCFTLDDAASFDQLADKVLEQISLEREETANRNQLFENTADQLRAGSRRINQLRRHDHLPLRNRNCNNDGNDATVVQQYDPWLEPGVAEPETGVRAIG